MEIRDEIIARVDQLPADMQQRVLNFVSSLQQSPAPRGESGASFVAASGWLDPQSAREMVEAIEAGCERVEDASEW